MLPKTHFIIGILLAISMGFIIPGMTPIEGIIIILASVLIDIDHYLPYFFQTKQHSLKRAYQAHRNLPKNHKPLLNVLHTVEILSSIFIIALFNKIFAMIALGFMTHGILDIVEMLKRKQYNEREHSLIRYLIKRESGIYFSFKNTK